ncbi:hypothetical protein B0H11DRAFT_2242830 [Mycena galericulata]|nr:hypothetical protein B0H11DRAFT_2242830 [Mycena galericulata]
MNLFPEALVDITSLLTTDPSNAEAKVEFQVLVNIQNRIDRRLAPEDILEADEPHAHGSLSSPRRDTYNSDRHQMQLPFFRFVPLESRLKSHGAVLGACHFCRKPSKRKELMTCKKCQRVNYCSVECQRGEWPEHKQTCGVAPDGNMTIRLGRTLGDHPYFHTHLHLYALRAIGPAKFPPEAHDVLLMVVVDTVPMLPPGPEGKLHIFVKNIVAVPRCIVPEEVEDTQRSMLNSVSNRNRVHTMWIATSGIYPEGEESRFRMTLLVAPDVSTSSAHLPNFSLDLLSHSFGVIRRVNLDLDFLFESINDELRLDVDNHYQLQT